MRRGFVVAGVWACALVGPADASAGIKTVNFDPDQGFAAGTVMSNQVAGVSFRDGPVVFDPQNTATFTEPHALRTSLPCGGGCHRMRIDFPARTSYVSLRVGADSAKGSEFGLEARMEAYDAAGQLVQSTSNANVAGYDQYGPIVTPLVVNRHPTSDIAYVLVFLGQADSGPFLAPGHPARVDIDELSFDAPGEPGADPPVRVYPPPPSVTITDPPSGTGFAEGVTVSGTIYAPAGLHALCTSVDDDRNFPATCAQTSRAPRTRGVNPTHVFTNVPVSGLHPGVNRVTAWVEDNAARRVASNTVEIVVPTGLDFSAENLEITQGVQRRELPVPTTGWSDPRFSVGYRGSGQGRRATYDGVPLAQGKRTVVRFYAGASRFGTTQPPEIRNVQAHLYAFDDLRLDRGGRVGRRLGMVRPYSPFGPLFGAAFDMATARADPAGAFTFVLPDAWTRRARSIVLVGVINQGTPRLRECTTCERNNAFAVSGVSFTPMRTVHVSPVDMEYNAEGRGDVTDFVTPFREMRRFLPAPMVLHPLRGTIDTTLENNIDRLLDRLEDWDENQRTPAPGKVIGIRPGFGAGVGQVDGRYAVTPVGAIRSLLTHEAFHTVGLEHAGTDPGCYAAEKDRPPNWPQDADQRGLIEAVGLDLDTHSGGLWRYQPLATRETGIFESPADALPEWFDLMSYCSGEQNAWLSVTSWTRLVEALKVGGGATLGARGAQRPAKTGVRGPALRVFATVDSAGQARILRVSPTIDRPSRSDEAAPFRIVVRGAGGGVVSSTGVEGVSGHEELPPGARGTGRSVRFLSAVVPARGAAAVSLQAGGADVAAFARSRATPSVTVLSPRPGARIGSGGRFTVSWRATDADRDALRFSVDFSADGGRTWRALTVGERGSSVRLPASLLTRSSRARLRVRASDGFNEGSGRSGMFRAAGRAPAVAILEPSRGASLNGDARLPLVGQAFDDAGRPLTGRALRWRSGRRTLGFGARINPLAAAIGGRVVLEARDRAGRRATDSVAVRVRRVAPSFVELAAPRRLARTARSVSVLVSSTLPGRLRAGGLTFAVGATPRRVRVPVPARRGVTRVLLRLEAFGRVRPFTLRIVRF